VPFTSTDKIGISYTVSSFPTIATGATGATGAITVTVIVCWTWWTREHRGVCGLSCRQLREGQHWPDNDDRVELCCTRPCRRERPGSCASTDV